MSQFQPADQQGKILVSIEHNPSSYFSHSFNSHYATNSKMCVYYFQQPDNVYKSGIHWGTWCLFGFDIWNNININNLNLPNTNLLWFFWSQVFFMTHQFYFLLILTVKFILLFLPEWKNTRDFLWISCLFKHCNTCLCEEKLWWDK